MVLNRNSEMVASAPRSNWMTTGTFTPADQPNTLIYLLAHKDKATRDASFDAFRKDPVWIAARDASEKDGKIVEKVEFTYMTPTAFSPKK